jgi:ATP-dependent helicase HrpA
MGARAWCHSWENPAPFALAAAVSEAAPATSADLSLESLLAHDAGRFRRLLGRTGKGLDAARLARDFEAARQRAERHRAAIPQQLHYPPELPVAQARESILETLRQHRIVVLCGETGSGKTTQLPKLCMEVGGGRRGLIGHTQPRRLAAELHSRVGDTVGFETRFDKRLSERTVVKLMTDGILLAELQHDRDLLAYDTLIIDEAHERSLNIDFLLGWLRRLSQRRPDLRIVITSATLDPERLARHFGDVPIINVSGRTYPVDIEYRPPAPDDDLDDSVASAVDELWGRRPDGDILVFLPGEREIHGLSRVLAGRFPHAAVLPLYSRLAAAQQDRVFSTGGPPRIVLATNVAETSVTVPGIRYVIDTGTARMSRYSPRTGVQQLQIEPVSQAAANQRAGRCGRVSAGICIRLYGEDDFAARPAFTDPEILRSNLAGVILHMATLGLGDVEQFPWVDAPESRHISEAYRVLHTLGAMDDERQLTPLGRAIGRLPLDPRIARIALAGKASGCAQEVFVLAAALSVQDPHEQPPESLTQARQKHAEWRHAKSDFFTLLQLWQRWQAASAEMNQRQLRKWCQTHYVSYLRMEEWEAVYRQIVDMVPQEKPVAAAKPVDELYGPIHQALLAGLVDHIGQKLPEKPDYNGPRGRRFKIFPGSALAKKAPPWLMHAVIVHTSQVFARTVAAIEPEWLESVAAHLVKRVLHHPEWNAARGEVLASEQVSLLGLALFKRQRHYGSHEPREARAIFIREALVRGDVLGKPEFLKKNLALIESVREKEARLRRPDLLAGEEQQFAFYDRRLPPECCTLAALKQWLRQPSVATTLLMQEADVLRPGADADVENRFPDHLQLGSVRVALSYQHDPAIDADGVSFHLPLAQLFAVPAHSFDWLVPGLLPDKIEALIRTLPQPLRRLCQPARDYAEAIAAREAPSRPLLDAICASFASMTGAVLKPTDFAPDKLPPHLKPRLLAEDAHGKPLGEADTLEALQAQFSDVARSAFNAAAASRPQTQNWVRDGISDWDFGDLPAAVTVAGGARAVPGLLREGVTVHLRLFESVAAAEAAHAEGVRQLLLLKLTDRVRDLAKSAKAKLALLLAGTPHTPESLAHALAARCADEVLVTGPIRSEAAFQAALEQRGQFSQRAYQRLDDLAGWLTQAATLRRALAGIAKPYPAAHADATQQLTSLLGEGFVLAVPAAQWPRMAVYLKALAVRLERLPLKPAKDADALRSLMPLSARLAGLRHPARWLLEEWRVALFAQELKAQGAPTAVKIEAALRG